VTGVTIGTAHAGRPRDPDVDRRVADAAIALFGEAGWAGFSVEAVAKRACVGKASIYLRWPTKDALLVEALRRRVGTIAEVDTGSLRGTWSSSPARCWTCISATPAAPRCV
jgi:AcrR family transcriptional regulator